MVDEEAIGSANKPGTEAKILRGDGSLERFLLENKLKGPGVRIYGTLLNKLDDIVR